MNPENPENAQNPQISETQPLEPFEKIKPTRLKKILSVLFVALTILLASFGFYVYQVTQTPNFQVERWVNGQPLRQAKMLYIPKGTDFKGLLDILKRDSLLSNVVSFAFLSKTMSYQDHVKPGAYLIQPNMTNLEALRMLKAGIQTPIKLKFNNIRTKADLAERLASQLPIPQQALLEKLNSTEFAQKYGLNPQSITTLFIPNTYEVYWTIGQDELFERMHKEYKKFWNETRLQKAKNINLELTEVSILASIVQAETAKNDEKPRVAGVYLNRLAKKDFLQADPTVIFAIGDFSIKRVLNSHLQYDSPYNTYKYSGLPPGAINLPEISSIDAVLNAEQHDYYFFCAKEDFSGYHNFAKNLTQHNQNARLYQKALSAKGY